MDERGKMADKKVKVKDGVTVTEEAVFVGDYMFKFEGRDYHYTEFNDWMIQELGIKDEKLIKLGAEYVASTYPWEAGVFYWERYNLNEKADKLKDNYVRRDIDIITNVVNSGMSEAEKTNRDDKYKWW